MAGRSLRVRAAFALGFALALLVGRATATAGTPLSLVYPAAGVAAVWFAGRRRPGLADHLLLVGITVVVNAATGVPARAVVATAAARVVQVHVFRWAAARWCTPSGRWDLPALDRVADVYRLMAAAALSGTAAAAVALVGAAGVSGHSTPLTAGLLVTRTTVGVLLGVALAVRLAPLRSRETGRSWADDLGLPRDLAGRAELAAALAVSATACALIFGVLHLPLAFVSVVVTAWVALRWSSAVSLLHDLAVATAVAALTLSGRGAFAGIADPVQQALVAQAFAAILTLTGLALATGRDERAALSAALRRSVEEAQAATRRIAALARASNEVVLADDPRTTLCAAARELTRADAVFLMEPNGEGYLAARGWDGDCPPVRLSMTEPSLSLDVYCTGEGLFVPDVQRDGRAAPVMLEGPARSAAWQPVVARGGVTVAVLVLVWHTPQPALPQQVRSLLHTLAAEASHLIERADLLAQLEKAAQVDVLTGLPNRRHWDAVALDEVARARRHGTPLTFAMIDLDHFKQFNDTHGHLAGDRLLQRFAQIAGRCLREVDTLARWGGEEFAVALPGCTAAEAAALARRVQAVVPEGQTCTIGVAQWEDELTVDEVLARADAALYRGKQGGRDLVVLHGRALPGVIPQPPASAV